MRKIHLILVLLFAFALLMSASGVASAIALDTEYVGNTMVDLSWTEYKSTDFSKYELYRDGSLIETIRDRTVTFYRDTGLTKGHTYNYEIRSYYTTFDEYWSDTTSATTGEVQGTITRDTTWTAASSPYTLTEGVDVRNGATLTITSGRVTNASSYDYDSNINVEEKGALYADSVSFSGVSLSIRDDSHADIKKSSFENDCGIFLLSSNNNVIHLNNFINNSGNSYSSYSTNIWNSTSKITYTYNSSNYTNYLGNYYDDYADIDVNNDGIWDNPRPMDARKDYHPLVESFENYVPVPPVSSIHDLNATAGTTWINWTW